MRYEATIHFEVDDENVDLTNLLTDRKIDISRFGLIGRTDDGELASQMEMGRVGVVEWTPEAKARIAQATGEISRRLEVDYETANRLWEGMAGVYEQMADNGLCAYPGGHQSVRVIPETLEFVRKRAAALPETDD